MDNFESLDLEVRLISSNKKRFLNLLLLADESEKLVSEYIDRGALFVLYYESSPIAVCLVTKEGEALFEIKNLAVLPKYQRKGFGHFLISFVITHYEGICKTLLVGTGESSLTIPFYENCGFTYSHRIENYCITNYPSLIIENGEVLKDKVYLKMSL